MTRQNRFHVTFGAVNRDSSGTGFRQRSIQSPRHQSARFLVGAPVLVAVLSPNGTEKGRIRLAGNELLLGSELRRPRPLPIIENSKLDDLTADQVLTTTR